MNKNVLILCFFFTLSSTAQNIDTLLYERFETGGSSFTLNTADQGGVSAAAGYNQWIVNDAYSGGSGSLVCLGFPFSFTIANTPTQPALITGGTNTNYMHIVSDAGQAVGVQNCCYLAADGICHFNETHFAAMNQDVITSGYDSVTVSFLWLCAGGTNIHGEFYYSDDAGSSWNLITTPISQYKNQSTWIQQSISLLVFAGQTTLRFGFRFVNQTSTAANEPGFGIDEFLITAKVASPPPVAAFNVSDPEVCQTECVDFTDQSAGNPTSWLWIFPGAVPAFSNQQNPAQVCYNTPGIYDVTLIVENSQGTDTLTSSTIIVHPNPAQPVVALSGDTLYATPGFPNYQWYLNGLIISGANNDFHEVLSDGTYAVSVTDTNGCSSVSDTLNFTTGLNQLADIIPVVYPNPATDILNLVYSKGSTEVVIYNVFGKALFVSGNVELPHQINLSKFAKGVYFVKVYFDNGTNSTVKFSKM